MGRFLSCQFEPWQIFEITTRCMQGRFLLKPGEEANRRVLGVFGRALEVYGEHVHLYLVAGTSNHLHMLVGARDAAWRARFKDHVKTNLAKELGDLHDWREHLFGRRARDIPVLDDEALVGRVRYFLAHAVKEGLCARPEDWPGPAWVRAVTEGVPLVGVWYDRTRFTHLRTAWRRKKLENRGPEPALAEVADEKVVTLSPLPIWAHLEEEARQAKYRDLVEQIVEEYGQRRDHDGPALVSAERLVAQDPHHRPETMKRSPAPRVHATTAAVRKVWVAAYAAFAEGWDLAMQRLLAGLPDFEFPIGGVLPPRAMGLAAMNPKLVAASTG